MSRCIIVMDVVAGYFSITRGDLISERRMKKIARPRQIAMWICRHETLLSFPKIGWAFGHRDHTTVMHACDVVEELRAADPVFTEATDNLRIKARLRLKAPGDVTPDQKSMIERELERQKQALLRMAIVDPVGFERRYNQVCDAPASPEQVEEAMGAAL